jgi:hypothetical protein
MIQRGEIAVERAGRHEVTVTKRDGSTSLIEVYPFGEFAGDGCLCRVDEVTRVLGNDSDVGPARTR